MNVPLVVLGAQKPSPSKMMVRSTLHQQPQQAKVEEEDVDADIIYLLLGFLVQMIWGEVPGENWEGFEKKLTQFTPINGRKTMGNWGKKI